MSGGKGVWGGPALKGNLSRPQLSVWDRKRSTGGRGEIREEAVDYRSPQDKRDF